MKFVNFIAALASASLGIGTLVHLTSVGTDYLAFYNGICFVADHSDVTNSKMPLFFKTGIQAVDQMICFLTAFFGDAKSTHEGHFASGAILITAFAFWLVAAIESTRSTARWFYRWYSIQALLSQLIGISVIAPLLWLSSYLLTKPDYPGKGHAPLRSSVVFAVSLSFGLFGVVEYRLYQSQSMTLEEYGMTVAAFLIVPIVISIVWTIVGFIFALIYGPVSKTPLASRHGSATAKIVYEVLSFILAFAWYYILVDYIKPYYVQENGDVYNTLQLILSKFRFFVTNATTLQVYAGYFLFIDAIVLWVTCVFWAAIDSGISRGLFTMVLLSFMMGPAGGLLFFAARREHYLGGLGYTPVSPRKNQ